jgi:hypothetical protein
MDSLTVTSTPPHDSFLVLIVPADVSSTTEVPAEDLARAALVFTADGRCIKNRYDRADMTSLKVMSV